MGIIPQQELIMRELTAKEKLMVEQISEMFGDAETIAKSMTGNAVARSCDLGINPALTLVIMKVLAELALKENERKFQESEQGRILTEIGNVMNMTEELERLTRHVIQKEWEKYKAKREG